MQSTSNSEIGDQFKKKRQLYSQNIRRNNREQLLNKRRNIDLYQETENINSEPAKNIFDQQYAEEIKKFNQQLYQLEFFDQYLVYLGSNDLLLKYKGLIAIRSVVDSDNHQSLQRFMQVKGLLQIIINYASQNQNQQLKYQSMNILSTITYGNFEISKRLVDCGAIQVSIQIIASNIESLLDFTLICLGNLSAEQAKFRDKILSLHGLQYLYKIINSTHSMNTYENSIWLITNLCRGTPPPQYELVDSAIPVLCNALKKQSFKELNNQNRNKVVSDVLWTLSNFTFNGKSRSDRLIEQGIINLIFHYAYSFEYSGIYFPATQILGNLASQGEKQTQAVIDGGIFDFVLTLLNHEKRSLRREGCWIISNLAAGTMNQTNMLIRRKDIFDKLSNLIESGDDRLIRQIIWVYPNLGYAGDRNELLKLYLAQNIIQKYINLIQINKEGQYLVEILKTLTKVLLIGNKVLVNNGNILLQQFINANGPQKVSNLQQHKSESVYDAVIAFLNKFFDIE